MGDFGDEFQNVLPWLDPMSSDPMERAREGAAQPIRSGVRVARSRIDEAKGRLPLDARGRPCGTLYFPPGTYIIDGPDLEIPETVGLWFVPGATLLPLRDVTVTIRGNIRAGLFQIFGLLRSRGDLVGVFERREGQRTAPLGRIRILSRSVAEIYPEWWGALPFERRDELGSQTQADTNTKDSWDAVQAAVDAGCRDRVVVVNGAVVERLPPIPVRMGGIYLCTRTVEARLPEGASSASVILRGTRGMANGGQALPTLFRDNRSDQNRALPDDHQWALRIHPGVSFELSDMVLEAWSNWDTATTPSEVISAAKGALDIQCGPADGVARRGVCRRCTFLGSDESVVRVAESAPSELLRRFTFDDAWIQQRFARARLDPAWLASNVLHSAGLTVDAGAGTLVRLHGAWVVDTPVGALSSAQDLPSDTGVLARGASVLVDGCTLHRRHGPRPSDPRFEPGGVVNPDGQDVFLLAPRDGQPGTHLTLLQTESQSWWLLGRVDPVRRGAHGPVTLLSTKQTNVNWTDPVTNLDRARRWAGDPTLHMPPDVAALSYRFPSVLWMGGSERVVLVASRFSGFVALSTYAAALDVGTTFDAGYVNPDENAAVYRRATTVPRRPRFEFPPLYDPGQPDPSFDDARSFTESVPHLVLLDPIS